MIDTTIPPGKTGPQSDRRVRALRLAAPDERLLRRGAILVEDALRTASLPSGGRLLLVRHLDLGRIRSRAGPSTVALAIEQRLRHSQAVVVHALDPLAASAPAVFFHDCAEALSALAIRLALGRPALEWFWPLVLPGWQPHLPPPAALRAILAATLHQPGGPAALLALVRNLHARAALDPLLAALSPADGPALLSDCGWKQPSPQPLEPPSMPPLPAWMPVLARWLPAWGDDDARTLWLAVVCLCTAAPARLLDARLPDQALQLVRQAAAASQPSALPLRTARLPFASVRPVHPIPPVGPARPAPPAPPAVEVPGDQSPSAATDLPAARPAAAAPIPDRISPPAARDSAPLPILPMWPEFRPPATAYAGLFFLLPLLARLGLPDWLADRPDLIELGLPQALLRHVAARLGAPPDDPIWPALDVWDAPVVTTSASRRTSPRLLRAWTSAMRRWLRRYARLGLRDLVCRPGCVAVSVTHVDAYFDHRQADIRIRRAGLDLDPGWLPWFGRVVLFHYE